MLTLIIEQYQEINNKTTTNKMTTNIIIMNPSIKFLKL